MHHCHMPLLQHAALSSSARASWPLGHMRSVRAQHHQRLLYVYSLQCMVLPPLQLVLQACPYHTASQWT